jgi:polar amino acid transport system substrate-binding protein
MMTGTRFPCRAARLVALLACVSALVAGCGSGGDTGNPAPTGYPTQDVVSGIAADPKLVAELPASARVDRTLVLGTSVTPGTAGLPHDGVATDGTEIGLDVDLRNAVARVLGITWQVRNGTFDTIIPGVQNGKFDVGADNFGVTGARERVVEFATYLTDGQAFLGTTHVSISTATSFTDLCGLTIATRPGSIFEQLLEKNASRCGAAGRKPYVVRLFADTAPIWLGLTNGNVDVYFGPTLSMKYDAGHVAGVRYLGQIGSTPVGFISARGSGLARVLSDAVNELIANGTYLKILRKWGVVSSGITNSAVDPAPVF